MLERLDQEKTRLRQELEYLEVEEARLTQQGAPISLRERAIEPTQQRLAEFESTLGAALERSFATLSPSQIALLRSLVMPSGVSRVLPKDEPTCQADLQALAQAGLVNIGEHGTMIFHNLVADYVAKRFGAT